MKANRTEPSTKKERNVIYPNICKGRSWTLFNRNLGQILIPLTFIFRDGNGSTTLFKGPAIRKATYGASSKFRR